jgi:hypothetical protein
MFYYESHYNVERYNSYTFEKQKCYVFYPCLQPIHFCFCYLTRTPVIILSLSSPSKGMKRRGQLDDTELDFIEGLLARGYTYETAVVPYDKVSPP